MADPRQEAFESPDGDTMTLNAIVYRGWKEGGVEQDGDDYLVWGVRYTRVRDDSEP